MKVLKGTRLIEVRVYLFHCLATFMPGMELPVFVEPEVFAVDISQLEGDELSLIIEEGRKKLDLQESHLERLRTRGATLLTAGLAEVAFLASGARTSWDGTIAVKVAWSLSAIMVIFGLLGAIAILTGRAVMGNIEISDFASELPGLLRHGLAKDYASCIGVGQSTLDTRTTLVRDAVLLLVTGALLYALAWPLR